MIAVDLTGRPSVALPAEDSLFSPQQPDLFYASDNNNNNNNNNGGIATTPTTTDTGRRHQTSSSDLGLDISTDHRQHALLTRRRLCGGKDIGSPSSPGWVSEWMGRWGDFAWRGSGGMVWHTVLNPHEYCTTMIVRGRGIEETTVVKAESPSLSVTMEE